jgi:PAS domain S-box-containing protein
MTEVIENSKLGPGSDVNQPMKVSCAGKPYFYFNSQNKIIDCNDALVSLIKIPKSKLVGSGLNPAGQNQNFNSAIQKATVGGISTFRGNLLLGNDLLKVYLETVLISIESANHHDQGIICYVLECYVPEKVIDKGLIGVENLFSGISNNLEAFVSVHTLDGQVVHTSRSIESLLGYSQTDLKTIDPLEIIYSEDQAIVNDAIERLRSGTSYVSIRYRMVRKDGSIVDVDTSGYLISDELNQSKHVVNITWDLNQLNDIDYSIKMSEQKYFKLVMNLPAGVSLIGRNGKLLEVNDAMRKIMGISAEVPFADINFFEITEMKSAGITDQLNKCINSKEVVGSEITYNSKRRSKLMSLSYSFLPVYDRLGDVDMVIGYVSDLTDQKTAESESRERADFLDLVINTIKQPFFVKDEEHKWVMLNNAAVEMMGPSREGLLGKSDYDLYPKDQADIFWKYDEKVFAEGSSINEEQITWSDGTLHDIVTHKQLYIEKTSGRKFIVGTIHDISNYKKIEQDLRASEMKYRELFDNANDFIITTDLEGNITNANRTLLNYLKTDVEGITKFNVYDYVSDENKELVFELKDKILSGQLDGSFEVNALDLDRNPVTYEIKSSLINEDEKPVGIQCVFSDITQSKEARLKLEKYNKNLLELNKTKDKFFSIIAHDLRNPYSSMIGFSELLLEDLEKLSMDEIRDSLKIIRNSAKNSLNLLENLLAWSRLETGRMHFDPSKVVLTDMVDEVVNVLFSLAYRKKIEINNMVESDVLLSSDKNMLNTILNNLVMNAIKFTPIGGEINIYATRMATDLESGKIFYKISVADTGIGMEPEFCKQLFNQNKPVSSPGTEKEQGTGLGLLLSREMVERHGGKIYAESTPGKGSVFSFLIPAFIQE